MVGTVHDLKCWPRPFRAVKLGLKPFEFRKDDRGFQVGDVLRLREFDPLKADYTGDQVERVVTDRLPGGVFGVPEGYCVLGLGEGRMIEPYAGQRLDAFLYLLARDHLPVGVVNALATRTAPVGCAEYRMSDPHLAGWAQAMAERLAQ